MRTAPIEVSIPGTAIAYIHRSGERNAAHIERNRTLSSASPSSRFTDSWVDEHGT
ncbi:hypothetical protein HMPREF0724_11105 [Prescottella equi ATCC 33707]|uniref:Uncharacterized protein n=1 Tax=Prescottella equi ATCC 33707 TaxID=525370 RepID=E9SXP0_RHOHA|nr:hypothetical protein HMPREF0724_11105 [Prescottella equi ATCC 33707]